MLDEPAARGDILEGLGDDDAGDVRVGVEPVDGRHEPVAVDDDFRLDANAPGRPFEAGCIERGRPVMAVAEDGQHGRVAVADGRRERLDPAAQLGAQVTCEGAPVEQPRHHPS
jgi:hypothetical protein